MTIKVMTADEARRQAEKLVGPYLEECREDARKFRKDLDADRVERKAAIHEYMEGVQELRTATEAAGKMLAEFVRIKAAQNAIRGEMSVLGVRLDELSAAIGEQKRTHRTLAVSVDELRGKVQEIDKTRKLLRDAMKHTEKVVRDNQEKLAQNRVIVDRVLKREVDLDNQRVVTRGD